MIGYAAPLQNLPVRSTCDALSRTRKRRRHVAVTAVALFLLSGSAASALTPRPEFHAFESLGGVLTSDPAVCSRAPGRLDLFGRGQDGGVYTRTWNGSSWSAWSSLGGFIVGEPSAASWSSNRMDVFGRASDDRLFHLWWNGIRWHSQTLPGSIASAPAVVSSGPDELDVFARSFSGQLLWMRWRPGTGWSGWQTVGGGSFVGAPRAAAHGERLHVIARDAANGILTRVFEDGAWSPWITIGGQTSATPTIATTASGQVHVFTKGTGPALFYSASGDGKRFTGWRTIHPATATVGGPAAVSWSPFRIDVFTRGTANQVLHTAASRRSGPQGILREFGRLELRGSPALLTIAYDFADTPLEITHADVEAISHGPQWPNVMDYFSAMSQGAFGFDRSRSRVISMRLAGDSTRTTQDAATREVIEAAFRDHGLDLSEYDTDGDGVVDEGELAISVVSPALPMLATSRPAATSSAPGALDVFFQDANGLMYISKTGQFWNPPASTPEPVATAPSVVSRGRNRLDVFWADASGTVWTKSRSASLSWSAPQSIGGTIVGEPSGVAGGPNELDVFVRGQNDHVWQRSFNAGRWSAWQDLGGGLTSAPAAVAPTPDTLHVFARGLDGGVWFMRYDASTGWVGWFSIGGQIQGAPAVVARDERVDVFARGLNDHLWHNAFDGVRWSGWRDRGGELATAPAVTSASPDGLDVFAVDPLGHVRRRSLRGSTWMAWERVYTPATLGATRYLRPQITEGSVSLAAGEVSKMGDAADVTLYAHELHHQVANGIDLYGSLGLNYRSSLMGPENVRDARPIDLDPWHKLRSNWISPRLAQIGEDRSFLVAASQSSSYPTSGPVILYDPALGSDRYLALEYRTPSTVETGPAGEGGYDAAGTSAACSSGGGGRAGVAVWSVATDFEGVPLAMSWPTPSFPTGRSGRGRTVFLHTAEGDGCGSYYVSDDGWIPLRWFDGSDTGAELSVTSTSDSFALIRIRPAGGDADGDGVSDESDVCPYWFDPAQQDRDRNGIGDACECGDANGDGTVDVADILAANAAIFEPSLATPLCDTNDDGSCDVADVLGINAKIFGAPAYCSHWPSP